MYPKGSVSSFGTKNTLKVSQRHAGCVIRSADGDGSYHNTTPRSNGPTITEGRARAYDVIGAGFLLAESRGVLREVSLPGLLVGGDLTPT